MCYGCDFFFFIIVCWLERKYFLKERWWKRKKRNMWKSRPTHPCTLRLTLGKKVQGKESCMSHTYFLLNIFSFILNKCFAFCMVIVFKHIYRWFYMRACEGAHISYTKYFIQRRTVDMNNDQLTVKVIASEIAVSITTSPTSLAGHVPSEPLLYGVYAGLASVRLGDGHATEFYK